MSNAWTESFSTLAKNLRPSAVSGLFKAIKNPKMISFAGGMPAPEVFPIDKFAEGAHLLKDRGSELLQYGTATEGDSSLRSSLIKFMAPRLGRTVDMEEILLTTGSQQALDLFAWAMFDKGDAIITEEPTYMAALNVFSNHGAQAVGVPCDAEGMMVDKLPALIEKLRGEGKKVKGIYTIVNFQNPGGMTMTVARRQKLAQIAGEYGVPIFEDDPYGYVRYEGEHLPSIFSFDKTGNTLYAGSFSKILSPGVRIGWVCGDREIIRKMSAFKQSTDLCSSPITQALVAEYCEKGYLEQHIPVIADNYRKRRDAMEESLQRHMKPLGVTWVKPEGGFFFWLKMPGVDCEKLMTICLEKMVAFVVGTAFCIDPEAGRNYCRLNFTYCKPDKIEEGIRRMAEAIQSLRK